MVPAVAAAALQTGGQIFGAISQGIQNRKQRKWNEKMYWTQRKNSLEDWQMQAAYNSPEQQMARLKQAGLNPHLVYGNGADAQMSAPVKQAEVQNWNPQAPTMDLGSIGMSYIQAKMQTQQTDNLEKQNTLMDLEAQLKHAEIIKTLASVPKIQTDTELGKINLEFLSKSINTRLQALEAELEKKRADTKFTLDENERKAAMQQPNLIRAFEEIYTIRLQRAKTREEIENLKALRKNMILDGQIKQYEIELNKRGLQKNDAAWIRVLSEIFNLSKEKSPAGVTTPGNPLGNYFKGLFGW